MAAKLCDIIQEYVVPPSPGRCYGLSALRLLTSAGIMSPGVVPRSPVGWSYAYAPTLAARVGPVKFLRPW
jgi:hypothetical protein